VVVAVVRDGYPAIIIVSRYVCLWLIVTRD
jgi:hypothetical protein